MVVEFYPVEVIKDIMSLTVGDVLKMNSKSGRYELHIADEDIGETNYTYNEYSISLEPWLIEKYANHFQLYKEKEPEKIEHCHFTDLEGNISEDVVSTDKGKVVDMTSIIMGIEDVSSDIKRLEVDLESFKKEIAIKLKALFDELEAQACGQVKTTTKAVDQLKENLAKPTVKKSVSKKTKV